ncbi:MAG: BCD family MFS transporter [Pseudomonadota bacterium]
MSTHRSISWPGIVRLGLVQTSLGAIVVMTTSTLNRIMVVELGLAAVIPGALVALHYFIQISRPRFGHGSDQGSRRTPWIIGGMVVLALGGVLAAASTAVMAQSTMAGLALAVVGFLMIGAGVGASGTCLLVLLAATVEPKRRAAAASITWIMMIAGFAVTAGLIGSFLDPFSFTRLVTIAAIVGIIAITVTVIALTGLETRYARPVEQVENNESPTRFGDALREVMAESHTRRFALFVFISMLAYSAQDLVLEPFAGAVFGMTPGQSTQLGGTQHAGVLLGMLLVAFIGYRFSGMRNGVMRLCMLVGCLSSSVFLVLLAVSGYISADWPLHGMVLALGTANGAFAVAAIGAMMGLVSRGHQQRDGVRMGVWGAAQAIAFGSGGIAGTLAVDIVRVLTQSPLHAYSLVFVLQAILFALAALLAAEITQRPAASPADGELKHVF